MPLKQFPKDLLAQATTVLNKWTEIGDGGRSFGDITTAALSADIQQAAEIDAALDKLEAQLAKLRNDRLVRYESVWDKVKRVRAGIKAVYGDNSNEYEMVGGTRASERKPRTRKASAA